MLGGYVSIGAEGLSGRRERFVIKKVMVVFIFFLLVTVGCSSAQYNTELGNSLNSIVKDKKTREINLTTMTTFGWQKAFLFTPYTPQEEIKKQLGVNFNDQRSIAWRDDIYLLVFMDENKVVQYVEVDHQGANLLIGENQYLTPSDDLIMIER